MKLHEVRSTFRSFWINIKFLGRKLKRRIWNKHILLWWNRLYIRKNEFHQSLEMDVLAMLEMTDKEKDRYLEDLIHRRNLAHQRYLKKSKH